MNSIDPCKLWHSQEFIELCKLLKINRSEDFTMLSIKLDFDGFVEIQSTRIASNPNKPSITRSAKAE